MSNIAIAGQDELQRAIQSAKHLESGVSFNVVGGVAGTTGVTNDKGLIIGSVSKNGQSVAFVGSVNTIGAPDIPEGEVKGLLMNVVLAFKFDAKIENVDEREIARVQEESGNVSQEAAMKRMSDQQKNSDQKLAFEIKQSRKKGGDLPNTVETKDVLSKVGKGLGSALSLAGSIAFTVLTCGGGTPTLVASSMGFASMIADVSGGYKKMEEKIADVIEEKNGKSRADAERIAGFISMGLQFAVEAASTIISCQAPADPHQKVADAINEAKKLGEATTLTENPKLLEAATEAATKIYGPNPTQKQVEHVFEQAEKIAKAAEVEKYVDTSLKVVMQGVDVWIQIDAMTKADQGREHEADLNLSQIDTEQVLAILAECGQNLETINRRMMGMAGKILQILLSASDSIEQING